MATQYTVKAGDTLSKIGQQYGVDYNQITGYSSGNPNLIRQGEVLSIPVDSLGGTDKPVNIPQQEQDTTDYNAIVAGGNALITPPAQTETSGLENLLKQYMGSQQAPESTADMYESELAKSGVPGLQEQELASQQAVKAGQSKLATIQAQLAGLTAEEQARQLRLREEGISAGAIQGRSISGERELAIRALPLQAQAIAAQAEIAGAQGDLEGQQAKLALAQDRLNTLYQLKSQDAQNQYEYRQKLIDSVYDFATKQEQARLDQKRLEEEQVFTLKRDKLAREHNIVMQELKQKDPAYQLGLQEQKLKIQKLQQDLTNIPETQVLNMAQSQAGINEVSDLLKSGGVSSAVGTSFLSRTPVSKGGFWGGVGAAILNVFKAPLTLLTGTYKDVKTTMTGERQNFIAGVEQLKSTLSLDSLIQAKSRGATFGALSDTEMQILAQSATKIGNWAIKDNQGNVIGYDTTEKAFKTELDKINNFAKLDYLLKGGNPEDIGVQKMDDGTYWTQNWDGTYTQLY